MSPGSCPGPAEVLPGSPWESINLQVTPPEEFRDPDLDPCHHGPLDNQAREGARASEV